MFIFYFFRYIESIIVISRMIHLERLYMTEIVELMKSSKQPSGLPSGSLISVPTTFQSIHQHKKSSTIISNVLIFYFIIYLNLKNCLNIYLLCLQLS